MSIRDLMGLISLLENQLLKFAWMCALDWPNLVLFIYVRSISDEVSTRAIYGRGACIWLGLVLTSFLFFLFTLDQGLARVWDPASWVNTYRWSGQVWDGLDFFFPYRLCPRHLWSEEYKGIHDLRFLSAFVKDIVMKGPLLFAVIAEDDEKRGVVMMATMMMVMLLADSVVLWDGMGFDTLLLLF